MSISLFSEFQNLNGLATSVISLIGIKEIFIWLLFIVALYLILSTKEQRVFSYRKLFLFRSFIIIFLISFFNFYIGACMLNNIDRFWNLKNISKVIYIENSRFDSQPDMFTSYYGLFVRYIREIVVNTKYKDLSNSERKKIHTLINEKRNQVLSSNSNKNLIFIIVESLLSDVINKKVNNKIITPNLNNLTMEGYTNLNVQSQVNKGMSADGQFIYFSGILPHSHNQTVVDYAHNTINGLGTALKTKKFITEMVVPTSPTVWRQDNACHLYGIDSLYSHSTFINDPTFKRNFTDEWLNDEQVLDYALYIFKKNSNKKQFLTVLTSSTHMPYNEDFKLKKIRLYSSIYQQEYLCYLEKCNYMDACLGKFLKELKNIKMFENTTIVIVADHHAHVKYNDYAYASHKTPMIILNSKLKKCVDYKTIGQLDLYPTILSMFNIKSNYMGIGYSLYENGKDAKKNRYSDKEHKLLQYYSDLILESNYFNLKKY